MQNITASPTQPEVRPGGRIPPGSGCHLRERDQAILPPQAGERGGGEL